MCADTPSPQYALETEICRRAQTSTIYGYWLSTVIVERLSTFRAQTNTILISSNEPNSIDHFYRSENQNIWGFLIVHGGNVLIFAVIMINVILNGKRHSSIEYQRIETDIVENGKDREMRNLMTEQSTGHFLSLALLESGFQQNGKYTRECCIRFCNLLITPLCVVFCDIFFIMIQ